MTQARVNITEDPFSSPRWTIGVQLDGALDSVQGAYTACLEAADETHAQLQHIAVPFFYELEHPTHRWDIAHSLTKALAQLDAIPYTINRFLTIIDIRCQCLPTADLLRTVFTFALPMYSEQQDSTTDTTDTPDGTRVPQAVEVNSTAAPVSDTSTTMQHMSHDDTAWYPIDTILRRQKRNGRDYFLIRWSDGSESWEPRTNITQFAIQQYFRDHPRRYRKRRG